MRAKRAHWANRFLLLVGSYAAFGCSLLRGVDVESVATSVQKPSNVALYVSVRDGKISRSSVGLSTATVYAVGDCSPSSAIKPAAVSTSRPYPRLERTKGGRLLALVSSAAATVCVVPTASLGKLMPASC